ncbi:MAG TPA: carboxypeptidase-like regulatory domain-containing protein [Polyangia bacterium]|nr:carboxypeptidase-like regulatory domain-containing protein [Polyangia bacterium]
MPNLHNHAFGDGQLSLARHLNKPLLMSRVRALLLGVVAAVAGPHVWHQTRSNASARSAPAARERPAAAAPRAPSAPADSAGGRVAGVVRWDDGTAAAGISVRGLASTGASWMATTAADGSYQLSLPPNDPVVVTALRKGGRLISILGGAPERKVVQLDPGEHMTGVDLTLPGGNHTISGVVLGPDGNPVRGAAVAAVPEIGGRSLGGPVLGVDTRVHTGADGSFTIDGLPGGLPRRGYTVWASHGRFRDTQAPHVPADATGLRIRFLPESVVAGIVVDSIGNPVTEYVIRALPDQSESVSQPAAGAADKRAVHDRSGKFVIHRLAPGTYDLVVTTSDGHAAGLGGVAVAEGERRVGLQLTIARGVPVRGPPAN